MNHIFYEIFETLPRLGPGSYESTTRALNIITSARSGNFSESSNILDIGCGTGIQTLWLAELTEGKITALDRHPAFLETLKARIKKTVLTGRVDCILGDMNSMNFKPESFDLIWAEGSVFIMGLGNGLKEWKKFLKPNGYLAFTDAFLFTPDVPEDLRTFWDGIYPDIMDVNQAKELIRGNGYRLIDDFPLPSSVWWDDFYTPLESQLVHFRRKYADNPDGMELIAALQLEIDTFRKYHEYYGYNFFILKKE